jgi:inner membrane protein
VVISSLGAVALGALLPDFDHPNALLARWKPAGRGGPFGIKGLFMPFLLPSMAVREALGHRGALHSVVAGLLVSVGTELLFRGFGASGAGAALGWGYATHLVADMCTRRGVPLLWPLLRSKFAVPRPIAVKSGSFGEALYLAAFSALSALHAAGALPT